MYDEFERMLKEVVVAKSAYWSGNWLEELGVTTDHRSAALVSYKVTTDPSHKALCRDKQFEHLNLLVPTYWERVEALGQPRTRLRGNYQHRRLYSAV